MWSAGAFMEISNLFQNKGIETQPIIQKNLIRVKKEVQNDFQTSQYLL